MKIIARSTSKKILLLSLFFIASGHLYADDNEKDDNRNPQGCEDTGYQFNLNTLQLLPREAGLTQSMYFLKNTANQKLTLYQMREEDSSRSMYLNHQIGLGEWAVFSTTETKVNFICTVPDGKSSYGKIVNCADNIKVCEYPRVKYGMNNRGNYWLVNSTTKNGAIREVVRYGIIPAV